VQGVWHSVPPVLQPLVHVVGEPATQLPEPLHLLSVSLPALHVEPQSWVLDANASFGQLALDPVQFSATSQVGSTAGRHTVVLGRKASVGHALVVPSQFSATSHPPADGRQTTVLSATASVGHAALVPVQLSATSHAPVLMRHTTVFAANPSVGHAALVPVQLSATSQRSALGRHTTVFAANASLGQAAPPPAQISATSHEPADARHVVPAAYFRHAPAPSHMPSLPHELAPSSAQKLFGSLAAPTLPQMPSPPLPFFVAEQAMQPLVHEVSQQTPSTQRLVPAAPHSPWLPHAAPCALYVQVTELHDAVEQSFASAQPWLKPQVLFVGASAHVPPQSTSVSSPFLMPSPHVAAWQMPVEQLLLWQSLPCVHLRPSAQGRQPPPQSLSVSVPFSVLSLHVAATHVFDTHFSNSAALQSVSITHATHAPLPSQTLPLLNAHVVPAAVGF
jgi:hypothetical protein